MAGQALLAEGRGGGIGDHGCRTGGEADKSHRRILKCAGADSRDRESLIQDIFTARTAPVKAGQSAVAMTQTAQHWRDARKTFRQSLWNGRLSQFEGLLDPSEQAENIQKLFGVA